MPRYAVLLHGRNVLLMHEGERRVGGVYAWRCVEAKDRAAAVTAAIHKLQTDKNYQDDVWNPVDSSPDFEAEQVDNLDPDVSLEDGDSACVFYIEDDENEKHERRDTT